MLPPGSSHLQRTAGPALCPTTVLLRIEFTASTCLHATGELLPHLSTIPHVKHGKSISVALVRGLPLAGVTRYPCPVEPGLSSCTGFRLIPAVVRSAHLLPVQLFCVFPVMPDVLDIVVFFEHIQHFLHIFDILFIFQGNRSVLRKHFHLSGEKLISL